MNPHEGHRERLLERFLKEGVDHFEKHNILELLLFFSIPRKDTNELAHQLIDIFGSFDGVLDAKYEDLLSVKGVGARTAQLIKLIPQLARYYFTEKQQDVCLDSTKKAGDFLLPRYIGRNEEMVFLVCLDTKCRVIATELVHQGSVNAAEVNIRKIVMTALRSNATNAIIAHNHPGGIALPSPEDLASTKGIKASLAAVDVKLIDHIIFADNDYVSLADSGAIL